MITLTLLHPIQSTPVQSWTFDDGEVIRVGRSTDNHVVLYSAVVSRNHVELRCDDGQWEVVSLGANGTYIDGKRVVRMPLHDGLIFRLARSGPNLQVHLGVVEGVAATIKSTPKPTNRIPMAVDDDMPQTLGLPGADPGIIAPPTKLALSKTAMGDDVPDEPAGQNSELLFSTQTGQPLKVLSSLGDYQVVKLLGQGETAVTSLAWRLGRTMVLKNLNAQMASEIVAAERFRQLAEQLQQLNHPGIPRVLEVIEQDGKTYMAMEMVYGQTLSQYVAQSGPLPQREAVAWMLELCETLAVMHPQGLVHGHITPNHVIKRSILRSGQSLVLTDFGTVRVWNWQQSGGFNPTSYLAPEQQQGKVSAAADLYAIGITLAFLLTGKSPKYFYKQQPEGVRFDPQSIPGIQSELADLIYKLTQPQIDDRLSNVADVMAALRKIV
ncbi:protein kinase domain-containing protein [Romeriopsis navalis]|uniref:protein kinase domain-containing protein n=1 Tax=Romeriopsis navalis TaxID=2992132 RepID=UPI0021F86FE3|nr:protein kinase [Romeriopsis navalis]